MAHYLLQEVKWFGTFNSFLSAGRSSYQPSFGERVKVNIIYWFYAYDVHAQMSMRFIYVQHKFVMVNSITGTYSVPTVSSMHMLLQLT